MPERWERELSKLRDVEVPGAAVRSRIEGGPRSNEGPPRHDRVLAALVAVAVAVVAGGFLWQTLPGTSGGTGDPASALPTLTVRFEQNGLVVDESDEQIPRVDTTIVYGDAREESFTSALPANDDFTIRWVAAEDLTPFVPGPTVGSAIDFQADGVDPRVLLGRPEDWPNFDRFTRIDRLPDEPGEYILVFQADYPGGIARTPRLVQLVEPGVLQLVPNEGGSLDGATASAFVDGRGSDGFLSSSWFMAGDLGGQSQPRAPSFSDDSWLPVTLGSPILVPAAAAEARAGLFPTYDDFSFEERLPLDLSEGASLTAPAGRQLLAVEVTWKHGKTGWANDGTEERALFFFPIEVFDPSAVEVTPVPEPVPSPTPTPNSSVMIEISRSSEETGDPAAFARFGGQDVWMCPDNWTLVNPDGTTDSRVFDCGQSDNLTAAAGTPIEAVGDFDSVDATARLSSSDDRTVYATNMVPGVTPGSVVYLSYQVEWDDGSTASFWLHLTVEEGPGTAEASILRIRCGDAGAEVLTPVVVAQPDGVHIQVDNTSGAAALEFTKAVSPDGWFGGPIDQAVRAWPIEPDEFYVECMERTSDTYAGLETARFEVTDPNGYWVPGIPECAEDDPLLKIQAYDGGGADYVNDEAAIRGMLHSVQPSDEVRIPFYPERGGSKDLRYVVVRDGRVVAYVFVGLSDEEDPQGAGLTEVTGEACGSSGIAQGSLG